MEYKFKGGDESAAIAAENEREENGIRYFDVVWQNKTAISPAAFQVTFHLPAHGAFSVWSPAVRFDRCLCPSWKKQKTEARLAVFMPLHAVLDGRGRNRMTVALSDAATPAVIGSGMRERDGDVEYTLTFFAQKVAPRTDYRVTVRVDLRPIAYEDSIRDAAAWWESACGYTPAPVPEAARWPMNSLWYSYHQDLDEADILKECRLTKAMGMDTVIVDDGWHTALEKKGYGTCGDWEVAPEKFPDLRAFVGRLHDVGMKVMLWFSVPFMGKLAKNYERFSSMLLQENATHGVLDPRYPAVRAYLTEIYANAIRNWDLDGLKLDFIDSFCLPEDDADDPARDFTALEDAVDALMRDVYRAVHAVKPDVLLEFRQRYVGPVIRQYGNMLRVTDCPADALRNRTDAVNLRLTSGKTAVHSDMLTWCMEDSAEDAAMQFIAVLFAVPQISVKVAKLPETHRRMLAFYLDFWRAHRDILLDGKLHAPHPESLYPLVCAEKDGKAVFAAYAETLVDCTPFTEAACVNGTSGDVLVLKGAAGKRYRTVNCMGETLAEGTVKEPFFEVAVPRAGVVFVG